MDNKQSTNEGLRELALFAGAGGGILGGKLLGWRTICAVEWDAYAASVLVARQNDGFLAPFPIWDDVQTFDGKPWRGLVDVVSGGFPCQDISSAGKGAGIEGSRSSMWKHMARIISEIRPKYAFVENSPLLVGRGLAVVLGDLAQMGYDAKWGVLGADAIGLPHHRARIWLVANAKGINGNSWNMLETSRIGSQKQHRRLPRTKISSDWRWADQGVEHISIFRDPADGLSAEVGGLKALGNAQVPAVARLAWETLTA